MIARLSRWMPVVVWFAWTAGASAANETPADRADAVQAPISALIADLDDADFEIRTRATRKLTDLGVPAIEPLLKAAEGDSLEAAVRAVSILENIYLTVDEASVEDAEQALEYLAASTNRSVAGRADRVLNSHYSIRQKRAVAQIQRLGGLVEFKSTTDLRVAHATDTELEWVVLGTKWAGGDEGLKHIRRLGDLRVLYVVSGTGITQDALDDLKRDLPQLQVLPRGQAYLGISGGALDGAGGIQVGMVRPRTAAAKAGIRPNDMITVFDGEKITSFDALIDLLKTKKAGDKVEAELVRDGRQFTIEIELGEWTPQ